MGQEQETVIGINMPTTRYRRFRRTPRILHLVMASALLVVAGCANVMKSALKEEPLKATIPVPGLSQPVEIRRDNLGIPYIEARTDDDLFVAMGFVSARDRLGQMLALRALTQGRLAEQFGASALRMDVYARTLDFDRAARVMWDNASPQARAALQRFSDGVNAYMAQGPLPTDVRLAGFKREAWKPVDSLAMAVFTSFIMAENAREEIAFLRLAQQVGVEKAAWLVPIYPDEPLPFEEAQKLVGLNLAAVADQLSQLESVQQELAALGFNGLAASNNWAVHKSRTKNGASIVANDTHMPLVMPSLWQHVNVKSPGFAIAGVTIPGSMGIAAGYNGHIGWGVTMVMGDNQDVYLEKLKSIDGKLHYLYLDQWLPCTERTSVFRVKGGNDVTETMYGTRHGVLLNRTIKDPAVSELFPPQLEISYGIALQTAMFESDNTVEALMRLMQSKTAREGLDYGKQVRSIPLNLVIADRDNIGWQVTGRYPLRKSGLGLLPSPGWTGAYEWQGYLDPSRHPASFNPAEGSIGTANNRTVSAAPSHAFSASWYSPERGERIHQLLAARTDHTTESSTAMQLDQHSLLADKLRAWLTAPANSSAVNSAIAGLDVNARPKALEALKVLQDFDGNLDKQSQGAAVFGAFLHSAAWRIFGDELGPRNGEMWHAFLEANAVSYGAVEDHLIQRGDESPFWDDIRTPQKETKADILALSLQDSIDFLEDELGKDRSQWEWGKLHTYHWRVEATKMAKRLPFLERTVVGAVAGFFDRGPFPAGGDSSTLNVSGYLAGGNFDTWLIPGMRMVVDFSRDEPMIGMNSTGQSGNPSSPHYDDANALWREGRYQPFPLKRENVDQQYQLETWLKPPGD